jgi:hypothetical protein
MIGALATRSPWLRLPLRSFTGARYTPGPHTFDVNLQTDQSSAQIPSNIGERPVNTEANTDG